MRLVGLYLPSSPPPLSLPCSVPPRADPSLQPSGSPHPLASGWVWPMGGASLRRGGRECCWVSSPTPRFTATGLWPWTSPPAWEAPSQLSLMTCPSPSLQTWADRGFLPLRVPHCVKVHLGSPRPAHTSSVEPPTPRWKWLCCQGPD